MKVLLGCVALVVFVLAVASQVVGTRGGAVAFAAVPLGMVAIGYLLYAFVVPAMFGRPSRVLPPAGQPVAMFRSGGQIGRLTVSGRLMRVTVYADRLTLDMVLLGEYTIHGSRIRSIIDHGGMRSNGVRIEHLGPGLFSRVTLTSVPDDARASLTRITGDPLPPGPPISAHALAERATARHFTTAVFVVAIVLCLALTVVTFSRFVPAAQPTALFFPVLPLALSFVLAYELVKFRRRVRAASLT